MFGSSRSDEHVDGGAFRAVLPPVRAKHRCAVESTIGVLNRGSDIPALVK